MNPQFTPKAIQEKLIKNQITKQEASELFVQVLEKSGDEKVRIETLNLIDKTILGSEKTFKLLETLLISDENAEVRVRAIKKLVRDFPLKSIKPFEWTIQHDTSGTVLMTLREVVDSSDLSEYESLKEALSNRLSKLSDEWGIVPLETLFLLDLQEQIEWSVLKHFKVYQSNNLWDVLYNDEVDFCVSRDHILGLRIHSAGIRYIPRSICFLSKLRYLNLAQNLIECLPSALSSLTRLKFLDLSDNRLSSLPDFWDELKSLRKLRLQFNLDVGEIPNSLFKLVQRNNSKRYIRDGVNPKEASVLGLFEIFTREEIIRIEESDDFWMDCEFCYHVNSEGRVSGLRIIGDELYQLSFIPEQIADLEYLEELNFAFNLIEQIPESIGKLKRLRILNLTNNKISTLPKSLKDLTSLEKLNLDDNLKDKIPEGLSLKARFSKPLR